MKRPSSARSEEREVAHVQWNVLEFCHQFTSDTVKLLHLRPKRDFVYIKAQNHNFD